jgi:hypothetical protein
MSQRHRYSENRDMIVDLMRSSKYLSSLERVNETCKTLRKNNFVDRDRETQIWVPEKVLQIDAMTSLSAT